MVHNKHIYEIEYNWDMVAEDGFYVYAKDAKEARKKFWDYMKKQHDTFDGDEDDVWNGSWSEIKDMLMITSATRIRMKDFEDAPGFIDPIQIQYITDIATDTEEFLRS